MYVLCQGRQYATDEYRGNIIGRININFGPREFYTFGRAYGDVYRYIANDIGAFDIPDPKPDSTNDDPANDSPANDWPTWQEAIEIRRDKREDPPDGQRQLKAYRGKTQAVVNPDAIAAEHPCLEDFPAFIDASERDDCLHKYDPSRNSGTLVCDHCNETRPWYVPLERGVRSLRPGGIEDGRPDFDHVDPVVRDIKKDDETGCPRCNGKSISYRKGSEDYRCNTCELEFDRPVPRQLAEDAERVCLFWLCRACERPTRAPFAGIPEDLLDEDRL